MADIDVSDLLETLFAKDERPGLAIDLAKGSWDELQNTLRSLKQPDDRKDAIKVLAAERAAWAAAKHAAGVEKNVLIRVEKPEDEDSDEEADKVGSFTFESKEDMDSWMLRRSFGEIYNEDGQMVTWSKLQEGVVYSTSAAEASERVINLERSQANLIKAEENELAHAMQLIIVQEGGYTEREVQVRMDMRQVKDNLGEEIAECDACVIWPGGRAHGERKRVASGIKQIKKLQAKTALAEQTLGVPAQSIRQFYLADLYPRNKRNAMLAYAKPRGVRMLERSGRGIGVITGCSLARTCRPPAFLL